MIDDVIVVPISTMIRQAMSRSAGAIPQRAPATGCITWRSRSRAAVAPSRSRSTTAAPLRGRAINWIDGLQNHASRARPAATPPELHVLHGHRHRSSDRPGLGGRSGARVRHDARASTTPAPLRLYESSRRTAVADREAAAADAADPGVVGSALAAARKPASAPRGMRYADSSAAHG